MKPKYALTVNIDSNNLEKAIKAYELAKSKGHTHQDIYILGCEEILNREYNVAK